MQLQPAAWNNRKVTLTVKKQTSCRRHNSVRAKIKSKVAGAVLKCCFPADAPGSKHSGKCVTRHECSSSSLFADLCYGSGCHESPIHPVIHPPIYPSIHPPTRPSTHFFHPSSPFIHPTHSSVNLSFLMGSRSKGRELSSANALGWFTSCRRHSCKIMCVCVLVWVRLKPRGFCICVCVCVHAGCGDRRNLGVTGDVVMGCLDW